MRPNESNIFPRLDEKREERYGEKEREILGGVKVNDYIHIVCIEIGALRISLSRFVYAMRSSIARFSGIRNSSRFAREGREETGSIVQGGRRETETRKEGRKEERKKENAYR